MELVGDSDKDNNSVEVFIESHNLQIDVLEFAGWKLYNKGTFPCKRRLEDLYMKKIVDGEIVVKSFSSGVDEEQDSNEKFMKNNFEEIRKIQPEEVAFQLNEGVYKIPVDDDFIELEYHFSQKIYAVSHDLFPYKKVYLRGGERLVQKFISEMDHYVKKIDKTFIKVFSPTSKGYWDLLCKNPKREVDTVFIKNRQEIIEDLEDFMNNENDYLIFGHPYKRNYLFYGPPGNGKTSFINAIASKYNFKIYMLSFSNSMTDEVFKKLVSCIPKNGLLVMEDIDALFDEKKPLSMSTVLNIMDGIARKNRIICLMTTNNYEKLTEVFKRPGRIDLTVEFNKADEECFKQMAEFMCQYHKKENVGIGEVASKFYGLVSHMEPSRALVQKFLFENRKKNPEDIFSSRMLGKFKEMHNNYCVKEVGTNLYS